MTWLRVDDTALHHPKVMHLRGLYGHDTALQVVGFVMLTATWSGAHLTDCWISEPLAQMTHPGRWEELTDAAVKVGMLSKRRRDKATGLHGWLVVIDDKLFHLMSREEVERNREHRGAGRRNDVKAAVLERDGDQCRYCGLTVNPKDTIGQRGRQLDHPDPDVHDVMVVACRGCNGIKGDRTAEEAGLTLLPPPIERGETVHLHPTTRTWLLKHGTKRADLSAHASLRPGTQPDRATPRPGTQPDPATAEHQGPDQTSDQPPRGGAEHQQPGRDGHPGLVGSGGPPRPRDGPARPRKRGRRGRRGQPA